MITIIMPFPNHLVLSLFLMTVGRLKPDRVEAIISQDTDG